MKSYLEKACDVLEVSLNRNRGSQGGREDTWGGECHRGRVVLPG